MTTNARSTFSWLAYSEREQQQARDLVSLLSERETRDELGIGSIRDAIANRLFPGTSTIQSRARYFLMIPWLFQSLEGSTRGRARERVDRAERELIVALRAGGDTRGLIGGQIRHVMRLPSEVYWAGLGVLGIRRRDQSLSAYVRWLDDPARHRRVTRDDDGDSLWRAEADWWDQIPPRPADFPEAASFQLTPAEAQYLAERALGATTTPNMLGWLFQSGSPEADAPFPWEHPQLSSMPAAIRDDLDVAQNFSLLVHGAALLFNLLIADARSETERIDSYRDQLTNWQQSHRDRVAGFDLNRVWELAPTSHPTRVFVRAWQSVVAAAAGNLADESTAINLVREREHRIKGARSRIAFPFRIAWNGASGAAQLDFRWSATVKQMTLDVAQGRAGA